MTPTPEQDHVFDFTPVPITPVSAGSPQPFWSEMVPTYNRREYLGQTLASILEQDPGRDRMQLCVVDNATATYDVPAFLQDLAGDRIEYVRHEQNIGGIRNINSCIRHARGQWVHVLHDDDIVMAGFYRAYEAVITRHPDAAMVICPMLGIDEATRVTGVTGPAPSVNDVVTDFLSMQAMGHVATTPSMVIPRWVYERVGAYAEGLKFVPDWEMAFRAGTCGPVVTLQLPFVGNRWHGGSDTAQLIKSQGQIMEMKSLVDELIGRLPAADRDRVPAGKYRWVANACALYASKLAGSADNQGRRQQLKWAYKLDPSPARFKSLARAYVAGMVRAVRPRKPSPTG
jgi:glycosyltransferase involved in cell wall biosynthesis